MLVVFNWIGAGMIAAAFVLSFAILGRSPEGPPMIMAGLLLTVGDLLFRATKGDRQWIHPKAGGMLFFAPVWAWGIIWLIVGIGKGH